MKKLFTLFAVTLTLGVSAQTTIDNPSFENWSDDVVWDSLVGWSTSTMENLMQGFQVFNTYQVGNAQHGNYAYHAETEIFDSGGGIMDTSFGYFVCREADGNGFQPWAYSDTVNALTGWYKCDVMPNDTAMAIGMLFKNGTAYDSTVYKFYGAQATWTSFTMPFPNGASEEPDSVWIGFASSDPFGGSTIQAGSWLEIDNVSFEFTVGSMTTPSQIPNYSFENNYQVTIEQPDDWFTFDVAAYPFGAPSAYTTKSTDAADGTYSIQLDVTSFNFIQDIPTIATNGGWDWNNDEFVGGSAYIAQPDQLTGKYKYSPTATDTAFVWVTMWNTTTTLVDTFAIMPAAASTWTDFSIDLGLTAAPDSMRIILYAGKNTGSQFKVDALDFVGGNIGYDEEDLSNDWVYYPNPTDDNVTIQFNNTATVEVIDMSGRIIYRNVSSAQKLNISTDAWNNGVYFIRLDQDGIASTKKLIVQH